VSVGTMKRGNRKLKAIDDHFVKAANNGKKIGEYIKQPVNRKQRRAMEAASKKAGVK
jgi:hypothetical protein